MKSVANNDAPGLFEEENLSVGSSGEEKLPQGERKPRVITPWTLDN